MANNRRGSRAGKRGSEFNRTVKLESQRMLDTGSTSGVVANGKAGYTPAMNTHFEGVETVEGVLVPRQALTHKHHLALFPQELEIEEMKPTRHFQLDKRTNKLVETTEPNRRLVWKSDKTLLNRSKVDDPYKVTGIKRRTSSSKRLVHDEREYPPLENSVLSIHGTTPIDDPLDLSPLKTKR